MKIRKKILIVVLVVIAIVLFVPYDRLFLFDGGTRIYTSVIYKVTNYHTFYNIDGIPGVRVGWDVEIFGKEIYHNTHIINRETGEIIEE